MLNDVLFYFISFDWQIGLSPPPPHVIFQSALWSSLWVGYGFVSHACPVIEKCPGRKSICLVT
jgi:hypothetical protein